MPNFILVFSDSILPLTFAKEGNSFSYSTVFLLNILPMVKMIWAEFLEFKRPKVLSLDVKYLALPSLPSLAWASSWKR